MTVISDDFNRSNEELGTSANWTEDDGDWEVVSNQVRQATAAGAYYKARWTGTSLAGNDNYCELDIVDIQAASAIGPGARLTSDSNVSGYAGMGWSGDAWYLIDLTAGGENVLGTYGTPSASTELEVQAEGTTIRLMIDNVQRVSVTDSSYSSGSPGLFAYGNDQDGDNWEAGDLGAAGLSIPVAEHHYMHHVFG
jgi:hypothetical protein